MCDGESTRQDQLKSEKELVGRHERLISTILTDPVSNNSPYFTISSLYI